MAYEGSKSSWDCFDTNTDLNQSTCQETWKDPNKMI